VSRDVTLIVLDPDGRVLGALPPVVAPAPYWQEAADVRAVVRSTYGVDVELLRLLAAQRPAPPGGAVTYLAQLTEPGPALPLLGVFLQLPEDPNLPQYARPGGPAASLAWASGTLAEAGLGRMVRAEQQRTWNLSAIWRLGTDAGTTVWLKQVPGFFAHEAALLGWLARLDCPRRTPVLLAAGGHGRMLLADIPGEDWYGATAAQRLLIVDDIAPVQAYACARLDELVALGVPDARAAVLAPRLRAVATPAAATVPGLGALLDSLDDRLSAIDACGVPDTLVHGDLHPGNVRVSPTGDRTIIDWGDASVGHPGFDILRLIGDLTGPAAADLLASWAAYWRRLVPGCSPERAVELLRPVAALRAAAAYASFLDHIAVTERPYHEADVPHWLAVAGQLVAP
jgi:hypothetical protein